MPGFELSERIDRPRDEVFDYFTDLDNATDWLPDVTRIEKLTDGPVAVGTRYRELRWTSRGEARIEMEVTAIEPPGQYSAAFNQGGYRATFNYTFSPDGGGTRIDMSCVVRAQGGRSLLAPMISWLMKRQDKHQLRNLKRAMEGEEAD